MSDPTSSITPPSLPPSGPASSPNDSGRRTTRAIIAVLVAGVLVIAGAVVAVLALTPHSAVSGVAVAAESVEPAADIETDPNAAATRQSAVVTPPAATSASPGGATASAGAPPTGTQSSAGAAPSSGAAPGSCTDGALEFRLSRETTFPTCPAMITQWRSFMATGGTETRQGDWICRLDTPAGTGSCALSDTDIFFTVVPADTAPGTSVPAAPAAPARAPGDLGLSVPMSVPACDGTGIVVLFSAVTPARYAQEVQAALDANPGSSYLRTDQSCPSLNQSTAGGQAIYAVYRVGGFDRSSVCAAVAGSGGYGKWLDNSSPPDAIIEC